MKRILVGCLGVAAVGIVVAGVAFWYLFVRELPTLEAELKVPLEAELNADIAMTITVTNPHPAAVTLDSIDVDNALLAGFQVIAIEPRPLDTIRVPFVDQRSWSFDRAIPPGESLTVNFTLKPVVEGRFSGDVNVCNPNQDFKTLLADIIVRKPPDPASPAGSSRQ
jgi:hypothetical protein